MRLCRLHPVVMLWCSVSVVITLFESHIVSATEIDSDTALKLIVSKEKEISSIRWECRRRGPYCPAEGNLSKVALDSSGRFRMQARGIDPVYDPKSKTPRTVGVDDLRTFDGDLFRRQMQQEPGDSLPSEETSARGYIRNEKEIAYQGSAQDGIQFFFPYFFPVGHGKELLLFSEYLRNKMQSGFPVWVNEDKQGVWEISTVSEEIPIRDGKDIFTLYIHILYAPGKGKAGAILKVVESPHKDFAAALEHKTGTWQEVSYSLQEIDGYWVPRLVHFAYGPRGSGPTEPTEYTYSKVELNRPLTKEDFIIQWKKGTFITDDSARQTYAVTGGQVDEKTAVDVYASSHGLTKPAKKKRSRYVLWVNSVLLVVLICIFVLRRWRKRGGGSLMLIGIVAGSALAGGSLPCLAQEAKQQEGQPEETLFEFDDGWWRVNDGRREARITQCAFYVTVFALNYLDVSCDPVLVSKNLPPSAHGVSLDRIQRVLRAHGLEAEGRKGVRFRDLLNLRNGECAILALSVPKVGDHYFVVAKGEQGLFCADVPRHVTFWEKMSDEVKADIEQRLAERQGIVLLVHRRSEEVHLSQSIRISSERVDLGEFLVDPASSAEEALQPEITFTNTSSQPVAVSLKVSCGCLGRMSWRNKIIDAGDEERLTINIPPSAWGVGRRAERVLVVFPDSSKRTFSIIGTGHAGQGTKSLHLTSSKEVRLQIAGKDARTYEATTEMGVFASPDISNKLEVESNVAWIQPVIEPVRSEVVNTGPRQESHKVLCTVRGSEGVLDELCRNNNSISGLVTVTAQPSELQVQFSVTLSRKPLLCVEPSIVSITDKGVSETIAIRKKDDSPFPITKLTATASPDGLACSIRKDGDKFLMEIRPTPERKSRNFVVTCHAEFENGDRDEGIVIAGIKEN